MYGSVPNLVSVYVEDEGKEYFYDEIMKRLLRDNAVHTKVFGLGGKMQVVEKFNQQKRVALSRKFFLIDGDFDELLGHVNPTHSHFHQLSRYDIESFLLEEYAFCKISQSERPRFSVAYYRRELQLGVLDFRHLGCSDALDRVHSRVSGSES